MTPHPRHGFDAEFGMYLRQAGPEEPVATFLYLHGLGESALGFEALLDDPRLGHCRHLAPDLPGYGKSPWTAEPLGLEAQADLLGRWLEARGFGPVVVVGHSMGGISGLYLAERHSERVRAFFNVEGNVSIDDCSFSGQAAAHSLETFTDTGMAEIFDEVYRKGVRSSPLRNYFASARMCDPRLFHRNAGELVEISRSEEPAPRLAALGIPVLYVLGHPGGTGEHSRRLLERSGIPWRSIEPAGHWPFLDRHDNFVDSLCEFLDNL